MAEEGIGVLLAQGSTVLGSMPPPPNPMLGFFTWLLIPIIPKGR